MQADNEVIASYTGSLQELWPRRTTDWLQSLQPSDTIDPPPSTPVTSASTWTGFGHMQHDVPPIRWKRLETLQGCNNLKYHNLTKEDYTIPTQRSVTALTILHVTTTWDLV